MSSEPLAARLRAAFLAELEEQVRVMNSDLLVLEREPANTERVKSLFRVAHTLKGAARAANVRPVEDACHAIETLLARVREGKSKLESLSFVQLFAAADALADARRRLSEGADVAAGPLADVVHALRDGRAPRVRSRRTPPAPAAQPSGLPPAPAAAPAPPETADRAEQASHIRIDAGALDAVLAATADLRQTMGRLSAHSTDLRAVDDLAGDTLTRWRAAARQLRARLASRHDTVQLKLIDDMDERVRDLARAATGVATAVTRDMQNLTQAVEQVGHGVVRLRMRPFAEICEALPRMVRDLSGEEGKAVRLSIVGGQVEADRGVLDALREPIVHLVRNAISHGVESPEARSAAGKSRDGSVTLSASLRGDRFIVTVSDDGGGLDTAELRRRLQHAGRAASSDDAELAAALFEGGISTRAQPSLISGRGVGLDVVRTSVERIGGAAQVEWSVGRGTTFTLDCPLTLASIRAVLAGVGSHTVAIPTVSVERVLRVRPDDITRAEGRDVLRSAEGPITIVSLARVLGAPYVERAVSAASPVVQLLAGGRRLAVSVDALIDECEVTVRPVDHRQPLPLISGAAMIATGGVAPVLNATALLAEGHRVASAGQPSLRAAPATQVQRRRIIVADDSITTRTLEQSVIEAAGYDVRTAADGAEAWRLLQEQPCDLLVSDVEMPRMDGFALCEAIRSSPRLGKLPVILVTALESAEQRARGLAVGADAYIGKSSFDQQTLLDVIRQFLE